MPCHFLQKFYKKSANRTKYLSVKYALDMKFHARYNSMNMRKHEQIFQLCSNPPWKIEYKTNSYLSLYLTLNRVNN